MGRLRLNSEYVINLVWSLGNFENYNHRNAIFMIWPLHLSTVSVTLQDLLLTLIGPVSA